MKLESPMNPSRLSIYFAVTVVIVVMLASGPFVPAIDFSQEVEPGPSPYCDASGNATISVKSIPEESFALTQRRFGAGTYHLSADEARVSVEEFHGCPIVVYRLTIDDLNYFGQRLYWIDASTDAELGLRVVQGTFLPSEMRADSYAGEITIRVRGDRNRTIYQTNVTIRVD